MSEQQSNNEEQELTLTSHLVELRQRLIRAILTILAIFLCLFYFANDIYTIISEPLTALLPEGTTMIATDVTSPFFAPFKLTIVLALFLSMPFILHQSWSFISPGLYSHERRLAIPLLISSIVLFYSGLAFAYFIVFPLLFGFFTSVGPENVAIMTDIGSYLNFVLKLFFAFGVVFEIPIATMLIIWSGITTAEALKSKRPFIIVGCFFVGMLLTPPDMISQSLLAVPMWLLFEVGILMSKVLKKTKEDKDAESTDIDTVS
ncbi:MAG: twin-arginine translocase subunit TatC [Oceanospirillaceae bacterium]